MRSTRPHPRIGHPISNCDVRELPYKPSSIMKYVKYPTNASNRQGDIYFAAEERAQNVEVPITCQD